MLQTVDDERRSNDAARWSLLLLIDTIYRYTSVSPCLFVFRFHASLIVHNYVINIYTIRSLYKLELNRVCFVQISIRSTIPLKAINQNTTNKIYIVTRRKGLSGVTILIGIITSIGRVSKLQLLSFFIFPSTNTYSILIYRRRHKYSL